MPTVLFLLLVEYVVVNCVNFLAFVSIAFNAILLAKPRIPTLDAFLSLVLLQCLAIFLLKK